MNAGRRAERIVDDGPTEIDLSDDPDILDFTADIDGATVSDTPDGGAIIDFSSRLITDSDPSRDHGANLAEHMRETDLNAIAERLVEAVGEDKNRPTRGRHETAGDQD